jgi:bacillithiol synthase
MAVDIRRFPWIRRLAADYAYNFSSLATFFSGDPGDRSAWAHAIRCAQANSRHRAELAAVLANQQERRGAPARARESARQLADSRTVALVTGQQAGLFGGPLFTLLKALTALKLADKVSREHSVPAVAVFWIDAEDHDWNEVRSCTVFDEALATRSISLPARPASSDPAPVATIQLDSSISKALDELESILPPTEFRVGLLADLRAAYAPGTGMATAFGRWLERVLGPRGLVVYDSSDPAAKPLASDVFVRELTSPGETARQAAAAGAELVARGYHSQVQQQDDAVALFHLDGGRRLVRQQGDRFVVGDDTYATAELIRQARTAPATFSPNVLLRPIVQDTVFPTICYVAGPNELAYLGQLRQIYERFGVPMPLMYPRASATLVDSGALRFLQKYKPPLEALQPQDESSLNQLLEAQIPTSVEDSFSGVSHAIETSMNRLIQTIPVLDPTLQGATQSTLGRMQHDLATLHNKMIQAAKRRDETLRRQYTRTRTLAFPQGHAQERTISFISFLNQYGPALIDRLDAELPLDPGHHWIVSI